MRRKRDSFKIISFMSTEPLLYSILAPYVLRKNQNIRFIIGQFTVLVLTVLCFEETIVLFKHC